MADISLYQTFVFKRNTFVFHRFAPLLPERISHDLLPERVIVVKDAETRSRQVRTLDGRTVGNEVRIHVLLADEVRPLYFQRFIAVPVETGEDVDGRLLVVLPPVVREFTCRGGLAAPRCAEDVRYAVGRHVRAKHRLKVPVVDFQRPSRIGGCGTDLLVDSSSNRFGGFLASSNRSLHVRLDDCNFARFQSQSIEEGFDVCLLFEVGGIIKSATPTVSSSRRPPTIRTNGCDVLSFSTREVI